MWPRSADCYLHFTAILLVFGILVVIAMHVNLFTILLVVCMSLHHAHTKDQAVRPIQITENNWRDMLTGEWLVKFHAPWCPACKRMISAWDELALWSVQNATMPIHIADVDVSRNTGLTGRFFITGLPTIFHIKDGEFRPYEGDRGAGNFVVYLLDAKWQHTEPRSRFFHPTSILMESLCQVFRFALFVREMHSVMTEGYGVPVLLSYLIFAVATVIFGIIVSLMLVFTCDKIFPPKALPEHKYQKSYEDSESDIVEDDMGAREYDELTDDNLLAGGDDTPVAVSKTPQTKTTDRHVDLTEGGGDDASNVRQRTAAKSTTVQ